jgi:hypothetical protein
MLSRPKSFAAVAVVAAALAVGIPASSASAATTAPTVDPTVCELTNLAAGPFGPTMFIGGTSLRNTLLAAGASVGCAPPAAIPSLFPSTPGSLFPSTLPSLFPAGPFGP